MLRLIQGYHKDLSKECLGCVVHPRDVSNAGLGLVALGSEVGTDVGRCSFVFHTVDDIKPVLP